MDSPNNSSTDTNPVGRFMVAVGAVIVHTASNKLLLIQRAKNLDWHPSEWEIMYGRMDQFETPHNALKREVREELGIRELQIGTILRVWHMFRGSKNAQNELIGITYHCQTDSTHIKLSSEHQQYKWVDPKEALQMVVIQGIKEDISRYLQLLQ